MSSGEIRETVCRLISGITKIPPERLLDDTSFRTDLNIDSLSLIEIGVAVDYEFRLDLPDESFKEIDTVGQTVAVVQRALAAKESATRAD